MLELDVILRLLYSGFIQAINEITFCTTLQYESFSLSIFFKY